MELIQPIGIIILLGICLKLTSNKVNRHECHAHIGDLKNRIETIKTDIVEIKADTKELLRRNGGER